MKYRIRIGKKEMTLTVEQMNNLIDAIRSATFIRFAQEKTTVGVVTVEPIPIGYRWTKYGVQRDKL